MGKINKFANIYDRNGRLVRHVNDKGELENYTIPELEELVDELAEDKDEKGRVKDPQALNNVTAILFQQYQKKGFSNKDEILAKLSKPTQKQAVEALKEVEEELQQEVENSPVERPEYEIDRYVEFEEVND